MTYKSHLTFITLIALILCSNCTSYIGDTSRDSKAYSDSIFYALENNDYEDAIRFIDSAIELKPEHAPLYNAMGYCFMFKTTINDPNNCRTASRYFTKAIDLDSMEAKYFCNRGWAYQMTDDYTLALKDFEKAAYLHAPNVELQGNILRMKLLMKDNAAALELSDSIIARFPKDGYAYHVRGNLKRDYLKKYIDGNKDLKIAEELGWSRERIKL